MIFKIFKIVFCGLVVVLVTSCAGKPSSPGGDAKPIAKGSAVEKLVIERAQRRWDALILGDLNGAYAFISPAGRLKLQAQDYRARVNTVNFRKAVVQEASCEVDSCDVKIAFDYVVGDVPLKQTLSEIWILDEGNWWFVYRG